MRIVLDTNVLVSGLLSPLGPPAQLLDLVLAGEATVLFDDRVLAEYAEVLARPRFGFRPEDAARLLDLFRAAGEHVTGLPLPVTLPDASDLPFLEVAAAGDAAALVTGNPRHYVPKRGRHAVRVLTPRMLVDALR